MPQPQQLERLLTIDRLIRAGRYPNAERIAAQLRLSKRLIYADKRFMVERLGAPIAFDRERGGWFYTDPAWKMPTMLTTESELLAFFLSVDVARRYAATALETPLRAAIDRLAAGLGGHVHVSLDQLSGALAEPPSGDGVAPELLAGLQGAVRERRPVWLRYFTAGRGEWTERVVEPGLLYFLRGAWYALGFDHLRGEMRNFRLDRIKDWQVMAAAMTDPAG